MAGRSRQSILAAEEKTDHLIDQGKTEVDQIKKRQTKVLSEKTEYILNGKKIVKREHKNGKVYSSYVGRTDLDKDLASNLKSRGMI